MGVSFIGNPLEQDYENEDSDWELNWDLDLDTVPNQDNIVVDFLPRGQQLLITSTEEEDNIDDTDDTDDSDFVPDEYDSFEQELLSSESEVQDFDQSYDSDEEELDYVTYPLNDEILPVENDKPTMENPTNPTENSDAD